MNWYIKQAQVVRRGEDHRVYEIIRMLEDLGIPEEPNWTHKRTATVGIEEYDQKGEDAAENFFLDVLAKAGVGDTDVMKDPNWGQGSEYGMMRSLVRILTQIDRDGNPIDRFEESDENYDENEPDSTFWSGLENS